VEIIKKIIARLEKLSKKEKVISFIVIIIIAFFIFSREFLSKNTIKNYGNIGKNNTLIKNDNSNNNGIIGNNNTQNNYNAPVNQGYNNTQNNYYVTETPPIKRKFQVKVESISYEDLKEINFYTDENCLNKIKSKYDEEKHEYYFFQKIKNSKILFAQKENYLCQDFEISETNRIKNEPITLYLNCTLSVNKETTECRLKK